MTAKRAPAPRSVPARLADVAREARCSPTAAGKVLNGTGGERVLVGKATAERIRRAASRLNYRPNFAARQLAGKPSRLVGILVDTGVPSVGYRCLVRIEDLLRRKGYRILVGQGHESAEIFREYCQDFQSRGTAGVICMSHSYHTEALRRAVLDLFDHEHSLPAVLLGRPEHRPRMAAVVSVNLALGIERLVDHLLSRGRTHPLLLLNTYRTEAISARESGFMRAMERRERREAVAYILRLPDKTLNATDLLKPHVEKALRRGHDAIICQNDLLATRMLLVLNRLGVRVPEDVSVAGVDNETISELVQPSLTTVDQRSARLSRAAVETLLAIVEGGRDPVSLRPRWVSPRLVIRESS